MKIPQSAIRKIPVVYSIRTYKDYGKEDLEPETLQSCRSEEETYDMFYAETDDDYDDVLDVETDDVFKAETDNDDDSE